MRLRDFPSWPTVWDYRGVSSPSADDISRYGIFRGVRLVSNGLSLAAEYKGEYCSATFLPVKDVDSLRLLRDKLRAIVAGRCTISKISRLISDLAKKCDKTPKKRNCFVFPLGSSVAE